MNPSTLITLAASLALSTGFIAPPLSAQAAASLHPLARPGVVQQPQLDTRLAQFEEFDFDNYDSNDRNNSDRNSNNRNNNNRNDRNNNGDRWNNSDRQGNSDRWTNDNRGNNGASRNNNDRWQDGDRWDNNDNNNDRWDNNDNNRSNGNGCYGAYRNRGGVSERSEAEVIAREFLGCRLGIDPYSRTVQIVGIGSDRRNWVVRGKVDGEFFRIDIDSDDAEIVNYDPPNGRNDNNDDDQDVIFF